MIDFQTLKKHKLHCQPEMTKVEYKRLVESIKKNGYNDKFPIMLYKGRGETEPGVIDGMMRLKACLELDVVPLLQHVSGSYEDVVEFIKKTEQRASISEQEYKTAVLRMKEVAKEMKLAEKKAKKTKPKKVTRLIEGSIFKYGKH
tara:strand:- start:21 stop:455 length:435 start_codon:yes stop_codon:yes gene_type:complete